MPDRENRFRLVRLAIAPGSVLLAVVLALAFGVALAHPVAAQTRGVTYDRFDVALELRQDATFHVVETQVVRFEGGPFTVGFRRIPLERIEAIRDVRVAEQTASGLRPYQFDELHRLANGPGRFNATTFATHVFVSWSFEPTSYASRTFVVDYDVVGALRVYPDENPPNQQIWWAAVGAELTEENDVAAARATIRLPRPVPLDQVVAAADDRVNPAPPSTDGQTFTWERGRIPRGQAFEVRLQFRPLVDAEPPAWQAADDERRAREEQQRQRDAARDLFFLAAGLGLVVGGGLGGYGIWRARGRDPYTGLVADFLTQPPDDLPPGAVGTLLDERADEHDIVATLLDLGRRGIIAIKEESGLGVLGIGGARDFLLRVVADEPKLAPFEEALAHSLFGPELTKGETARLSGVHAAFVRAYPTIMAGLYDELVARGYFPRSPEATRKSWRLGAQVTLVVALAIAAVSVVLDAGLAWLPALVVAGLALAALRYGGVMPRKTAAGADAAARWRAFRRYLADIERYESVGEADAIFDRYLPYAVAFGLERSWVEKFAAAGAPTPGWFSGGGSSRRTSDDWGDLADIPLPRGGSGAGGRPPLPDLGGLQGLSDRGGRSLQISSDALFTLLRVALMVFSAFAGGGSRGGASGGGGGGFR